MGNQQYASLKGSTGSDMASSSSALSETNHPHDDRRYNYRLAGFQHAHSSDVTVCRPIVDWDRDETAPVR